MQRSWSPRVTCGLLVFAMLAAASDAGAIAAAPPYATGINAPLTIPPDGVLAVGTVDWFSGTTATQGALESVTFNSADPVAGTGSEFTVSLGAETTQTISVWKPEQPFAVGSFTAVGLDEYGNSVPFSFEVVDGESAPLDLSIASVRVVPQQVPARQIPCGTTFGISAEMIPVYVTTHYSLVPVLGFNLVSSSSDTVLSQHFFRFYRPDVDRPQFLPYAFVEGERALSIHYTDPQPEYCVGVESLALSSQQLTVLDPVCATDEQTDWTETIPATSEDIDVQLLRCPSPPQGFEPRYCALREEQLGADLPQCDAYTDEELEEAADTPIVVDDLPEDDAVEPTVEPSVEPVATPATGEPGPAPVDSPVPSVSEGDVADDVDEPSGLNGEDVPGSVLDGEPAQTPPSDSPDEAGTPVDSDGVDPFDAEAADPGMASDSSAQGARGSDGGCAVDGVRRPSQWLWGVMAFLFVGLRRRLRS